MFIEELKQAFGKTEDLEVLDALKEQRKLSMLNAFNSEDKVIAQQHMIEYLFVNDLCNKIEKELDK